MIRNRFISALLSLPQPSAMLVGIDALDLRICEVKPYLSSGGKEKLAAYIFKVNSWLFCQTNNLE